MRERRTITMPEGFFCDGHWYVMSSTSLGGSGLTPAELGDKFQADDAAAMNELLEKGVCLPLFFDCDCCLDDAVIVLGDLSEVEESEWIGRLQSKLEIPCGEFFVMAGGLEEDLEEAVSQFKGHNPHGLGFHKIKVEPGTYLVEIYAFLGSFTVNDAWEDAEVAELETWWDSTRPGEPRPGWIQEIADYECIDGEADNLLEYIIRLSPLAGRNIPIPELAYVNWPGVFEMRKPALCPRGITRGSLGLG